MYWFCMQGYIPSQMSRMLAKVWALYPHPSRFSTKHEKGTIIKEEGDALRCFLFVRDSPACLHNKRSKKSCTKRHVTILKSAFQ